MGDFGIKVSRIGSDVGNAEGVDVLMNTEYPHAKLDTSKPISFQNITFTFNNNPPDPPGTFPNIYQTTTVRTQAHGYAYIPAVWALIKVTTPTPGTAFYQSYFLNYGVIDATSVAQESSFYVEADATNVYFKVRKYLDTGFGGAAHSLVGTVLKVRVYVFADEVTT